MKASVFIFGVLAAVVAGGAVALLLGDVPGYIVAGTLLLIAVAGLFASRSMLKGMLAAVLVAFFGGIAIAGWALVSLFGALGDTEGPVAAPDPVALASAEAKIDAVEDSAAFRLELSEEEMRAYALEELKSEADNPVADVTFDITPGDDGGGELAFVAELKSGGTTAEGAVGARLENGAVQVDVIDVGIGSFNLPGLAEGAIEGLVEDVADFNQLLIDNRADVQAITFTETTVIITGTQAGTDLLTEDSFLTGFAQQAASVVDVAEVPDEQFGPGVVDGTSAGGAPFYVALGDSLAANVGVDSAADGYVSRFHNQLQIRDGRQYGLRNVGISGETTGTLIRGGQLDDAVAFMEDNEVAYVTIDIGANNLLGHLGTADCSESLDDPACRQRVADSSATYPRDLAVIFEALTDAAPDATIIFLTAYNPFSLGFGSDLEADMDRTLQEFNALAVDLAEEAGFAVADGFGAMDGTAAVTTHMLDAVPDIHPIAIGFDLLTGALVEALG